MENCEKYPDYSGEHLACEIRNEQLNARYWEGFNHGAAVFFIIGLVLMWFYLWCDGKEKELKNKIDKR